MTQVTTLSGLTRVRHRRRPVTRMVEGPLAGFDQLLAWVVRIVWLNACWLGLTLLGGIVGGIGPATVAAFVVALAWVRGDREVSVPATMWDVWKATWWPATRNTILIGVLAIAVGSTWWMSRYQPPVPAAVAQGLTVVIGLALAVIAAHLIWVVARDLEVPKDQQLPISRQFATALAVSMARPILTITLLAAFLGWPLLLFSVGQPGLLPLTCLSVPMLATAWAANKTIITEVPGTGASDAEAPGSNTGPADVHRP